MKKFFFILSLSIFMVSFSQTKNIKILYKVKATKSTVYKPIVEDFILFYTPEKSLFINRNRAIGNRLLANYLSKKQTAAKLKASRENLDFIEIKTSAKDPELVEINKYEYKNKWLIEKDFKDRVLTFQDAAFMSTIKYTQELPVFKWQIEDSTKQILGYEVQKAKLHYKGRDFIAWFSPDIQIPDGPYKFWGLPGLIMEIYDVNNDYHFLVKGIEEFKVEDFPKSYFTMKSGLLPLILTTEKKFNRDFNRTFSVSNVIGNTVVIGEDRNEYARERVEKFKQKYNNPIERAEK